MVVVANIFQPLIDVFQSILLFFHNHVGLSWGFSIIALTILMRAILLPLTVKQFHSMQKLQRMQPQMKALQAKYKDDKQRQQQEMMKFYKENEINPLGSCLPLVAQLPVFISLFYMLRKNLRPDICPQTQHAYQLKYAAMHHVSLAEAASHTTPCGPNNGAGFLFIPDLTNKATGWVLIVLLLLYVGSQLASSLMMSSPMMDKQQRNLMLLLPLVFVVIVINFPAGLLVYWITTNLWTMGQQYTVRRMIGTPTPPAVAVGPGPPTDGGGGRGGGRGDQGGGGSPPPENGGPNGAPDGGGGGGIGGLIRGRPKREAEPVATGGGSRKPAGAPPPPPKKKKKRSGRRR
ncbi:MAG TPA: YidC/Oxa1 family membrane protein insertase [Solirubrobacteraceae bacterium]|nr:YidC/Oxa1 family membrane protein insertase [Solirubrobacteraceae bacterium]